MPTGYAGEGRVWSPREQKWVKKSKAKSFDYAQLNQKSLGLLMSFFRWFPDMFFDCIQSKDAKYNLELIQRVMLRILARYRNVYFTGARGLTKTYVIMLSKTHGGIMFPGKKIRYSAPSQKQSAILASKAFREMGENFPLMKSWWDVRNDRADMFKIVTQGDSEFTMYVPRGDTCSETIAEEMGQEGDDGFDMQEYESKIAPTRRLIRTVNKEVDPFCVQLQSHHIGNACSKTNKAFSTYRAQAYNDMIFGKKRDGFALDIPWEVALLCQIRNIEYFKSQRAAMTPENWLREFCAIYTGSGESPMILDTVLSKSQRLKVMEEEHCGDPNAIYVIAHDVSAIDSFVNAKCADIVLKLTRFKDADRRTVYRKQVVYIDFYPPQKTYTAQARKVKEMWCKYYLRNGIMPYIVVDANGNGDAVAQELIKEDFGTVPLCSIGHIQHREIEKVGAQELIYPLKAGGKGSKDQDSEMVLYAQSEFHHGNVELPTTRVLDGVETYKRFHGIKDSYSDAQIAKPYQRSEVLIQQISNLQVIAGKEKRKSKHIQRDLWSALKYALWFAHILEQKLQKEEYGAKSDWQTEIEKFKLNRSLNKRVVGIAGERQKLLSLRRR